MAISKPLNPSQDEAFGVAHIWKGKGPSLKSVSHILQ